MEDHDCTRELLSARGVWREIWTHFPIWFLFLEGLGIHHIIMANLPDSWFAQVGISRNWFALLMLPLSLWFYAYYRVRLARATLTFDRRKIHLAVLATAFGLPFVIWAWYTLMPFLGYRMTAHALHRMFEFSNVFWAAVMLGHTLYFHGYIRFVTFYLIAFVYGMALENAGIYLGYFFEPNYLVYLGKLPAPLATMVGWCIVFLCCITLIEYFREYSPRLRNSTLLSALATTALAISADAQLDPLASFPGMWWQWHKLLPPIWFGVPFCNYAAWFGAFIAFSYLYFYLFSREDLTIWQKNWRLLYMIPSVTVAAGGVWFVLMLVWETIVPQGAVSYPTLVILGETATRMWPY